MQERFWHSSLIVENRFFPPTDKDLRFDIKVFDIGKTWPNNADLNYMR